MPEVATCPLSPPLSPLSCGHYESLAVFRKQSTGPLKRPLVCSRTCEEITGQLLEVGARSLDSICGIFHDLAPARQTTSWIQRGNSAAKTCALNRHTKPDIIPQRRSRRPSFKHLRSVAEPARSKDCIRTQGLVLAGVSRQPFCRSIAARRRSHLESRLVSYTRLVKLPPPPRSVSVFLCALGVAVIMDLFCTS